MAEDVNVGYASVDITPGMAQFASELLSKLSAVMSGVPKQTVEVGATTNSLQAKLAAVQGELLNLTKQVYTAKLGATADKFYGDIAALKTLVDGLTLKADVSATIDAALGEIAALKAAASSVETGNLLAGLMGGKGSESTLGSDLLGGALSGAASAGTSAASKGILSALGWGGGLFGMAGFGSILSLLGFGGEHLIASGLGVAGSGLGAGVGGGLLGLGSIGVAGTGMLTDMAAGMQAMKGIKTLANQLTQVTKAQQMYTTAVNQYGAASAQATTQLQNMQQAQLAVNQTMATFAPISRGAIMAAAQTLVALKQQFVTTLGLAVKESAQLITTVMHHLATFIPVIGQYAAENIATITQDIQPLLKWLDTTTTFGGMRIFKNLEDLFQRNLPTAITALTQGLELFAKVVTTAAQFTGPFLKMLDTFLKRFNGATFGKVQSLITTLVGSFRVWLGLGKQLFITIMDIFKPAAGFGDALVGLLTKVLTITDKWLTSASGKSVLQELFTAHLQEVITAIGGLLVVMLPLVFDLISAFAQVATMGALFVTIALKPIVAFITLLEKIPFFNTIVSWAGAFFLLKYAAGGLITMWNNIADAITLWIANLIFGKGQMSSLEAQFAALSEEQQANAQSFSVGMQMALEKAGISGEDFAATMSGVTASVEADAASMKESMAGVAMPVGMTPQAMGMLGGGEAAAAGAAGADLAGAGTAAEVAGLGTAAGEAAGGMGVLEGAMSFLGPAGMIAGAALAVGGLAMSFLHLTGGAHAAAMAIQTALKSAQQFVSNLPRTSVTAFNQNFVKLTNAIKSTIRQLDNAKPNTAAYDAAAAKLKYLQQQYHQNAVEQATWTTNTTAFAKIAGGTLGKVQQAAGRLQIQLTQAMTPRTVHNMILALQKITPALVTATMTTMKFATGFAKNIAAGTKTAENKMKQFTGTWKIHMGLLIAMSQSTVTTAVGDMANSIHGGLPRLEQLAQTWGVKIPKRALTQLNALMTTGGNVALTKLGQGLTSKKAAWAARVNGVTHVPDTHLANMSKKFHDETTHAMNLMIAAIDSKKSHVSSHTEQAVIDAANKIKTHQGTLKNAGYTLMIGLANGIDSGQSAVINSAVAAVTKAIAAAKAKAGSHSPSRVFMELGLNLMQGLAIGIDGGVALAVGAATRSAQQVITAFQGNSKLTTPRVGVGAAAGAGAGTVIHYNPSYTIPITPGSTMTEEFVSQMHAILETHDKQLFSVLVQRSGRP